MSVRFYVRFVIRVGGGNVGEKTYFTRKINVFIVCSVSMEFRFHRMKV